MSIPILWRMAPTARARYSIGCRAGADYSGANRKRGTGAFAGLFVGSTIGTALVLWLTCVQGVPGSVWSLIPALAIFGLVVGAVTGIVGGWVRWAEGPPDPNVVRPQRTNPAI